MGEHRPLIAALLSVACALSACTSVQAEKSDKQPGRSPASDAPPLVYFSQNWCPSETDLALLSKHLILTMNGCCIAQGIPRRPDGVVAGALHPWLDHLAPQQPWSTICAGTPYEDVIKEKIEARRAAAEAAAEDKYRSAREAETSRLVTRERDMPKTLRGLNTREFCIGFGIVTRGNSIDSDPLLPSMPALMLAEAQRRHLRLDMPRVRAQTINIGATLCQMYASMGRPDRENRSVGSWGVHIQHGFEGLFVYTQNGTVTSFQD